MSVSATLSQFSADLEALVERAGPTVVGVRSGATAASGTAVGADRVVMANHGLDPEASVAEVWVNGTARAARVLGRDASTDLAVLATEGLDATPLGPGRPPAVGAVVVNVGRAWDRLVADVGIVHSLGALPRRRGPRLEGVLRTTIAPYPGFSGAPLLDTTGAVIAIATAGLHRGAGLGLPWDTVTRVVDEIATHGRIRRGFLGVSTLPVDLPPAQVGQRGERSGLLVTAVVPDGPAAAAGVLVGDVLIDFDGQPVPDADALLGRLTGDCVGRSAPVTVVRGMASQVVTVTVGERGVRSR